jgi:hypothetical protein
MPEYLETMVDKFTSRWPPTALTHARDWGSCRGPIARRRVRFLQQRSDDVACGVKSAGTRVAAEMRSRRSKHQGEHQPGVPVTGNVVAANPALNLGRK